MSNAQFAEIIARLDSLESKLQNVDISGNKKIKEKKPKKEKDPNAPKRPLNWYFLLKAHVWNLDFDKNLSDTELKKKKLEKVTELQEDDKIVKKFKKEAEKLSEAYKKDLEAYNKKKVEDIAKNDSDTDTSVKSGKLPMNKNEDSDDDEEDIKKQINAKRKGSKDIVKKLNELNDEEDSD